MRGGWGVLAKRVRTRIKESLIEQLEDKGVIADFFFDLVEDYMRFYDIKMELLDDIKKRGVSIYWQNSETSYGYKKNDSVDQLVKISGQIIKILDTLKITVDEEVLEDDDDDF